MSDAVRLARAAVLALLAAACSTAPVAHAPVPGTPHRRAILVSFDALNERRALETLPPGAIPAFRALFAEGACTEYAVPAWPSKTAASHASLWTGAYGDVNGISANWQPMLPRDRHAITEGASGYRSDALRAEPIWVTAALAGRRVVAHHPTQAPGVPGYAPENSREGDPGRAEAGAAAAHALAGPHATVFNGYNRLHGPDLAITERTAPPRPAIGWRNLERLGAMIPPKEIAWSVGGDSVFALIYGRGTYRSVLLSPTRDASNGVVASLAPVERGSARAHPLARHFSAALPLDVAAGRIHLRIRVFELTPDASRFLIFQPAPSVVESNRDAEAIAYADAIGGWVGNGAQDLLVDGGLGTTLLNGGDGTAELRYLESLELVTRQFMLGSEWSWARHPDLMLDYFPVADEVDHMWYGLVSRESPAYRAPLAGAIQAMRVRAWELVDLRLEGLQRLVATDSSAALFVSGDHGMRATWRIFRPNVALAAAGLLVTDDSGRVIASRTKAYAPDGLYVTVNTTEWLDGTVRPGEVGIVVARADSALRAVVGVDGAPVVIRTWHVRGADSLGRGGPVGGHLYFETAPGYVWSRGASGPAAEPGRSGADHGFPSISADMFTVFCAAGPAIRSRRLPAARTIDVAPTVSRWLGMPAPRHARGEAVEGIAPGR
ncbi:MAG TPA: alkaline phosphatase family protein [Gemmatimonadales bacterium]|nr:alkaline phosphatase family protein [Gemmatimonadales bacterium]